VLRIYRQLGTILCNFGGPGTGGPCRPPSILSLYWPVPSVSRRTRKCRIRGLPVTSALPSDHLRVPGLASPRVLVGSAGMAPVTLDYPTHMSASWLFNTARLVRMLQRLGSWAKFDGSEDMTENVYGLRSFEGRLRSGWGLNQDA